MIDEYNKFLNTKITKRNKIIIPYYKNKNESKFNSRIFNIKP
jgi:hypothetical protein